ncbi:MAG: MaoC family dehydratase [Casimicrobiaceae bacterium]
MTLARVLAFSGGAFDEPGWPQRNLHTDLAMAQEAGLDAIIASGTQSEGLLLGLLVATFGTAWHERGSIELRFLKPVRVGDTVRPKLQWTSLDAGHDALRFATACWCERDNGERVLEGTATCTLPIERNVRS